MKSGAPEGQAVPVPLNTNWRTWNHPKSPRFWLGIALLNLLQFSVNYVCWRLFTLVVVVLYCFMTFDHVMTPFDLYLGRNTQRTVKTFQQYCCFSCFLHRKKHEGCHSIIFNSIPIKLIIHDNHYLTMTTPILKTSVRKPSWSGN